MVRAAAAPVTELFEQEAIDAPPLIRPSPDETDAARTGDDAAAVAGRLGIALPGKRRSKTDAELALEGRAAMEALAKPSVLRDVIAPIPIIVVGLVLSFLRATRWSRTPAASALEAVFVVIAGAVLAVGMMLLAMWLLISFFDVNFMGSFRNCMLRLCAIAIGPAVIREIIVFHMGEEMGVLFLASLATLAAYGVLFWALMRVDVKDALVCTIVTFGIIMFTNYIAFRMEGMRRGSDI